MDYLQYQIYDMIYKDIAVEILNLIINGLPSIPYYESIKEKFIRFYFNPYYKWITFNTHIFQ